LRKCHGMLCRILNAGIMEACAEPGGSSLKRTADELSAEKETEVQPVKQLKPDVELGEHRDTAWDISRRAKW